MQLVNKQLVLELFLSKIDSTSTNDFEKVFRAVIVELLAKYPYLESKREVKKLLKELHETLDPIYATLQDDLIDEAKKIALLEANFLVAEYVKKKPIEEYLASFNKDTTIFFYNTDGTRTDYKISEMIDNNKNYAVKRLGSLVAQGLQEGLHPRVIKKRINDLEDKHIKNVSLNLVSSIVGRARQLQNEHTMQYVEKVLDGEMIYLYHATLENNTCARCAKNDSMIFKTPLSKVPQQYKAPLHPFCRCRLILIPKGHKIPFRSAINYDNDLREGDKVNGSWSYKDWFATIPPSYQKAYLGKKGYKLYKDGYKFEDIIRVDKRHSIEKIQKLLMEY